MLVQIILFAIVVVITLVLQIGLLVKLHRKLSSAQTTRLQINLALWYGALTSVLMFIFVYIWGLLLPFREFDLEFRTIWIALVTAVIGGWLFARSSKETNFFKNLGYTFLFLIASLGTFITGWFLMKLVRGFVFQPLLRLF
ncbi:MAG: hypothetical protein CMH61_01995 [Nanoarchaeota archaeon]|nr:hypothetical protein [Nanoarchaeota archaeon]|tara:strand:+ start:1028 stop:1450 length:423 start_codon:yes stop_codon:yes gene_type:complete